MALIHRLLFHAAQRLAADPRVQRKAAAIYDTEVRPRAEQAWRDAKPRLDAAKAELRQIAAETDPRADPKGFAAKVKERLLDRRRSGD